MNKKEGRSKKLPWWAKPFIAPREKRDDLTISQMEARQHIGNRQRLKRGIGTVK